MALGLAEAGLMSKRAIQAFDEMCLTPVEDRSPEDICALWLRETGRQAELACCRDLTTGLVRQRERGDRRRGENH